MFQLFKHKLLKIQLLCVRINLYIFQEGYNFQYSLHSLSSENINPFLHAVHEFDLHRAQHCDYPSRQVLLWGTNHKSVWTACLLNIVIASVYDDEANSSMCQARMNSLGQGTANIFPHSATSLILSRVNTVVFFFKLHSRAH